MSSPKITVFVGISGSGKSTIAKSMKDDNTVIISRDPLRCMLFGYNDDTIPTYYSRKDLHSCEKQVSFYFDEAVKAALRKGKNVIADNTHLTMKYINAYKKYGVLVEYVLIDAPIDKCIANDAARTRKVGVAVIKKQAKQLESLKKSFSFDDWVPEAHQKRIGGSEAVICDLDGTLCHLNGRSPYDTSQVLTDSVDPGVLNILDGLSTNYTIFLCSGRDGSCRADTEKWLESYDVPYYKLLMRPAGNTEKDWLIKQRMWKQIESENFHISFMIDDRDQVVDHARRLGYKVLQVDYGTF